MHLVEQHLMSVTKSHFLALAANIYNSAAQASSGLFVFALATSEPSFDLSVA